MRSLGLNGVAKVKGTRTTIVSRTPRANSFARTVEFFAAGSTLTSACTYSNHILAIFVAGDSLTSHLWILTTECTTWAMGTAKSQSKQSHTDADGKRLQPRHRSRIIAPIVSSCFPLEASSRSSTITKVSQNSAVTPAGGSSSVKAVRKYAPFRTLGSLCVLCVDVASAMQVI